MISQFSDESKEAPDYTFCLTTRLFLWSLLTWIACWEESHSHFQEPGGGTTCNTRQILYLYHLCTIGPLLSAEQWHHFIFLCKSKFSPIFLGQKSFHFKESIWSRLYFLFNVTQSLCIFFQQSCAASDGWYKCSPILFTPHNCVCLLREAHFVTVPLCTCVCVWARCNIFISICKYTLLHIHP